jgi:hypothetical protein
VTSWGRSHLPCSWCWDGVLFLSLPWWSGPYTWISWQRYWYLEAEWNGTALYHVQTWLTYWDGRNRHVGGALWPYYQLSVQFVQCTPTHNCREHCICLLLSGPGILDRPKLQTTLGRRPTVLMLCLMLLFWNNFIPPAAFT